MQFSLMSIFHLCEDRIGFVTIWAINTKHACLVPIFDCRFLPNQSLLLSLELVIQVDSFGPIFLLFSFLTRAHTNCVFFLIKVVISLSLFFSGYLIGDLLLELLNLLSLSFQKTHAFTFVLSSQIPKSALISELKILLKQGWMIAPGGAERTCGSIVAFAIPELNFT